MVAPDVIVVGGGVIGTAVTYALAREGVRVTLLERQGLAAEASGANPGFIELSERPAGPLFELTRASLEIFAGLEAELGYEIHFERIGSMHMYGTEEQRAATWAQIPFLQSQGLTCHVLDGAETRALEPVISPAVLGSVFVDQDGVVYPHALTLGFAAAARRLGAAIETGPAAAVTAIRAHRDAVQGVETGGGFRPAGTVVLANGAWAAQLAAPLGVALPVTPMWGQVLVTERVPRMVRHIILGLRRTLRQTPFGNILVCATLADRGFDKGVDLAAMRQLAADGLHWYPGLRGIRVIRTWSGLRPATPDGFPVMGWAPGITGLFLAGGHHRNGVCNAPASGRIVADLIVRGHTWPWAGAFSPDRFVGKEVQLA